MSGTYMYMNSSEYTEYAKMYLVPVSHDVSSGDG